MTQRKQSPAKVSCDGKAKLTAEVARKLARRQRASLYHCAHCKAWHVGHVLRAPPHVRGRRPKFFDTGEDA